MEPAMTRHELAKKCGVNIEALRYYEKRRLLDPVRRTSSNYRIYSEADIARVRFIKNAQKLGFSLKEVQELIKLRVYKEKSCERAMKKAQVKLEDIETKIKTLNVIKRALKELIAQCEGTVSTTSCPILSKFESQNKL